jgi:hypothetical protein
MRGDTVVVRTLGGSVWGDSVRLEEELRIGVVDGDERYTFTNVRAMAVGRNGDIYVVELRPVAIRQFDAKGQWVRTFSRAGGGPGEIRRPTGMVMLSDGRLVLPDADNGRTTVFSADGRHLADWRVEPNLISPRAVVADSSDRIYIRTVLGPQPAPIGVPRQEGLTRVSPQGEVIDTIPAPPWPDDAGRRDYKPRGRSDWHPGAYWVTGWSADYAFELRRPTVLRVEREWTPVVVSAEELADTRAALIKANETMRRMRLPEGPVDVAQTKPAYRSLTVAQDGRVWVVPHLPSEKGPPTEVVGASGWIEPTVYDVFDGEGRYMGRVTPPANATFHVIDGDHVWGVQRGADDEPYVARWRIVTEGES